MSANGCGAGVLACCLATNIHRCRLMLLCDKSEHALRLRLDIFALSPRSGIPSNRTLIRVSAEGVGAETTHEPDPRRAVTCPAGRLGCFAAAK